MAKTEPPLTETLSLIAAAQAGPETGVRRTLPFLTADPKGSLLAPCAALQGAIRTAAAERDSLWANPVPVSDLERHPGRRSVGAA